MAMFKYEYIIFVCSLNCLCCVLCELNLNEDEPCITKGLNGTCVGIFRCVSASYIYLYANAGIDVDNDNFSELPDICSYKNNEPVVCCTDCRKIQKPLRGAAVRPLGRLDKSDGSVAADKCLEYFGRLPYWCRGYVHHLEVKTDWKEDKKCHDLILGIDVMAAGGRDAQRWEFPHVALLGFGDDTESAQWLCGGSIISEWFILTAAHCTSTPALGNITFAALGLLKRTDPNKYWKIYNIERIIIHPEYKSPSKYHDIALLKTETEINFGKDLLPACLSTGSAMDQSKASSGGWGRLGNRQALADTLQVVELYEYNETECAARYQPHRLLLNGYDHDKQMCYGGEHQEIADTCEGDSGGPLQVHERECQYIVVGVASFGKDCGTLGSAGMYTRVSYYIPWIESVVWPEEVEEKKIQEKLWLDKLLSEGK